MHIRSSSRRQIFFLLALLALAAARAAAQETVDITLPVSVSFSVSDVSAATAGSPEPTTISFSSASLAAGNALWISVKADAAEFTRPGGSGDAIPASNVSWTTSNAQGGSGSSGTLSAAGYNQVYQSNADPSSGSVDVSWSLSAPGSSVRAGDHTLTIRWKLESVAP